MAGEKAKPVRKLSHKERPTLFKDSHKRGE
jgi:hypothetical protein